MTPPTSPPSRQWPALRAWVLGAAAALAALGLAGVLLMTLLFPNDVELARRAAQALGNSLGTPVSIGALRWQLLPQPRVDLLDVAISQPGQGTAPPAAAPAPDASEPADDTEEQPPSPGQTAKPPPTGAAAAGGRTAAPIALQRITLWPALSVASLWTRTVQLRRVEVDGASVPQRTLARLKPARTPPDDAASSFTLSAIPVETLVWRRLAWQPRYGVAFLLSGEASFGAQWRPNTATVQLLEAGTTTDFTVRRTDTNTDSATATPPADARWAITSRIGGGSVDGELALLGEGDDVVLSGKLTPKNVEVASALAAFNRRSAVRGKASGTSVVSARAPQSAGLGALAMSLQTDTRFTMGASELTRFDLGKAVRSLGADTLGQTPLDSITGQMTTRNTPNGMVTRFVDVKARSGVLSAVGTATVGQGRVDATLAVDLVDGVVGVPLRITGPTSKVSVSVPPSALAGAAVGTAVLPGVGTAVGARLGAALGRLFGTSSAPAAPARGPRAP